MRLSVGGMGDVMISEKAMLVGNRIKMMRLAKGLRQKHVADMLTISQSNMSNIESGRSGVNIEHLFTLQEIFACSMNDFFVDIEKSADKSSNKGYTVEDLFKIVAKLKGYEECTYEKNCFDECSEKSAYCFGCDGGVWYELRGGAGGVCGDTHFRKR